MSYQRDPRYWSETVAVRGNSITICSCMSLGTQVEQNPTSWEVVMLWAKDAVAGAGIVLFMVSAFALASGAHAILTL